MHDTIVNQLLTKIDGVDALNNILLIGMTNRCVNGAGGLVCGHGSQHSSPVACVKTCADINVCFGNISLSHRSLIRLPCGDVARTCWTRRFCALVA